MSRWMQVGCGIYSIISISPSRTSINPLHLQLNLFEIAHDV
jgi:hypothetical protein